MVVGVSGYHCVHAGCLIRQWRIAIVQWAYFVCEAELYSWRLIRWLTEQIVGQHELCEVFLVFKD